MQALAALVIAAALASESFSRHVRPVGAIRFAPEAKTTDCGGKAFQPMLEARLSKIPKDTLIH